MRGNKVIKGEGEVIEGIEGTEGEGGMGGGEMKWEDKEGGLLVGLEEMVHAEKRGKRM